ncbi:MAG: complex I NDUFA9 subunit family protein [Candidatus Brocadiaceae bacterium]|nr:complex I NDUFA9 subunit family protein [Candidatus Brocadiaceae bacterium]
MKIFLTGSTGFIGKQLLQDLIEKKYHVRCLVRQGSENKIAHYRNKGIEIVSGDIVDADSLQGKLAGCDVIINLVGIIREFRRKGITFEKLHYQGTVNIVAAAQLQGVKRFIQMSALGANAKGKTHYQQTKFRAEEWIKESGLDYTIFRPSIVFGPEDKFVNLFAKMLKTQQFVPVIGDGTYQLQPVAVENVSMGFIKAIEQEDAIGKIFEVGGSEKMAFDTIIDTIADVICTPSNKIHVPVWIMGLMAELFDWLPIFPVTKEQITMLIDGNTCNEKPFFKHFNLQPIGFQEGIAKYLRP